MDVFNLRDQLVEDYAEYISSFIHIHDERIKQYADKILQEGQLWPDPLIQLNPSFEAGKTIHELIAEGLLDPECANIFRINKETPENKILKLHKHQEDALRVAANGKNYVLTTGTGSGKSLAYIIPIVDHVLRHGSGKGIQAIIVYPMNALANSQLNELEKFINLGYPDHRGPVRFARFTGQESEEEREQIRHHPPDILLTNYVMLELILTRPEDRVSVIKSAQGLPYFVLDELHTYRGRQGADVAMLVRRLRDAVRSPQMLCIGTSATLASEGTYEQQQEKIAEVATIFFGTRFDSDQIIGETLQRATTAYSEDDSYYINSLKKQIQSWDKSFPTEYQDFIQTPLASWIESNFGVDHEFDNGRLIRAIPISITGKDGAAQKLAQMCGEPRSKCEKMITACLMAGYQIQNPETEFPVFAFRLHQFISPGENIYTTIESSSERYLTVNNQQFKPGDRSKNLYPVVFCRECGQEYYSVRVHKNQEDGSVVFLPRDYTDLLKNEEDKPAYLYLNEEHPWEMDENEIINRIPDDWLEAEQDIKKVKDARKKSLPENIHVSADGVQNQDGISVTLLQAPFLFCLHCGAAYSFRLKADFTKLTALSSSGRSTSTTILSLAAIRKLKQEDYLEKKARKLLSFTDNRQDAALQAGHFNDFIETSLIRTALYQAVVKAGENGMRHDELTQKVDSELNLPFEKYASNPEARFAAKQETEQTFRDVLGYRLYRDLRRGWRVTAPNLEQSGLLKINYLSLEDMCSAEDIWGEKHIALVNATPETRQKIAQVLLDTMRRELALQVEYLSPDSQDRIRQRSSQRLIEPWAIDENEYMESASILFPRSRRKVDDSRNAFLSARSGFGLYLNNPSTFPDHNQKLNVQEREQIIVQILEALRIAGIVEIIEDAKDEQEVPGYQIKAAALIWIASDGSVPFHDPLRMPNLPETGGTTNDFFVRFYQTSLPDLYGLRAKEHTAQVPYADREAREKRFRTGELPILYCSPTMELGIDISQLNVVNMRNVPPTPANYAQRSGRAGRSGQPALVFTYCAKGSPHDQYFFKRKARMVSGAVNPPRLDLANHDLIRAHVHAIWLAETNLKLGISLKDILDLSGDSPSLELLEHIKDALYETNSKQRALIHAEQVLDSLRDNLEEADWYSDDWLNKVFAQIPEQFERACERWRNLYRAAFKQREQQDAIIRDASRSHRDRERARSLRREAENQLELLLDTNRIMQSDFYIYRYFASEGFLPGYNFPRLPLSAYIPARKVRTEEGEYLSRPRFLAVSEFGPRSIVYHEGSKYSINRVIMQVTREEESSELTTERIKVCPNCGYLHPVQEGDGLDKCERCGNMLAGSIRSLFRMQNVSTKRRERINSDEEERLRFGYEIKTAIRFQQRNQDFLVQRAELYAGEEILAKLTYGDAATLWRINLGWRRRKNQTQYGFLLDIEKGYWQKNDEDPNDADDPMDARTQRVIPYVEDHKNALIFEPTQHLEAEVMASLTAALKKAIQVTYQLEDNELAAEALPSEDDRRAILFYEASEGGAGVLRQLVKDTSAIHKVANTALDICHFDPATGEDLQKAPLSDEICEAACYDCLMSYYNQRDHPILDRQLIRELLITYRDAESRVSPVAIGRDTYYQELRHLCQSELEEKWLNTVHERGYRLPSKAQHLITECNTRPDFIYEQEQVVIYVDGYYHLDAARQQRDIENTACLEDLGFTVLRFGILNDWERIFGNHSYLFGN